MKVQDYIKENCKDRKIKNHSSGEISLSCPVHNGKNYNFSTKGDIATCFSKCGRSYDVVDLHAALNNLSKYESINDLSMKYGIRVTRFKRKNTLEHEEESIYKTKALNVLLTKDENKSENMQILNKRKDNWIINLNETVYGDFNFNGSNLIAYVTSKKGQNIEVKEVIIYPGYIGIIESVVDLDEGKGVEYLKLVSYFHNIKKIVMIPKSEIANENKMIERINSTSGLIVKSKHKKLVVEYLEEQYEGYLRDRVLNTIFITKNVGFFTAQIDGTNISTFIYPNHDYPIDPKFKYSSTEPLNEAFIRLGSSNEWIEGVYNLVKGSRNAFIAIVGAFASILIEPLRVGESFIIDLSGRTSTGKTTLLKVVASIYGKSSKLINDLNSTFNSIISKAVQLRNYPLLLDDSKKADKNIIGEVIYILSGGKEKGRSNINGDAKKNREFRNIAFTNGEVQITEYLSESTTNGRGAYGRVLTLEGGLLPNSKENSGIINLIQENSNSLYGTIGYEWSKFVYKLLNDESNLESWRIIYRKFIIENNSYLKSDISRRRGVHIALLKTAYELMTIFNPRLTNENSEQFFEDLLESTDSNCSIADNYLLAHQNLIEKFKENTFRFNHSLNQRVDIETGEAYEKHEMWGDYKNGKYYILSLETIQRFIEKYGDTKDILNRWRELNVLEANSNRFSKSIRVGRRGETKIERRYVITEDYIAE